MQEPIEHPPRPAAIAESMRDIGYSFPSALADIVDNCISAEASHIDIQFRWNHGEPIIAILDDGHGMSQDVLLEAMRPGTKGPATERSRTDLGRFGLGLKTASFSQCRRLSVFSRASGEGKLSGFRWDLDLIAATERWALEPLHPESPSDVPFLDQLGPSGTLVLWEKIDRLVDKTSVLKEEIFNEHISDARRHLELVFHRFLAPMADEKGERKIRISLNNLDLEPFDPFFPTSPARQVLPAETMSIDGQDIKIQPYILPHHSRVSADDYRKYGGAEGYAHSQGFYVYRNRRLIDYGTWFRLARRQEATRLARVRIDIPNTLDHLWGIDVRKSRATPPGIIRQRLRRIIGRITSSAGRVYTGRGKKSLARETAPIWHRVAQHGTIRYEVNREHPLVQQLVEQLSPQAIAGFTTLLDLIGSNLPVDMLFADLSSSPDQVRSASPPIEEIRRQMRQIIAAFMAADLSTEAIREHLRSTAPFNTAPQLIEDLLGELAGEH